MVAPPLAAGGGPPGGALSPAAAWMEAYADSTVLVVRLAGAVDMAPDVDVEAAINHHHRALVTMTDFLKLNTDGSLIWKFRGFSTRYLFFCCPVVNAEEHADVMAGAVLRLRALLSRQKSLGGAAVAATFGLCSGPTAAALIGTSVLEMVIEGNPVHVAKQLAREAKGIAVASSTWQQLSAPCKAKLMAVGAAVVPESEAQRNMRDAAAAKRARDGGADPADTAPAAPDDAAGGDADAADVVELAGAAELAAAEAKQRRHSGRQGASVSALDFPYVVTPFVVGLLVLCAAVLLRY